jgi:hypothetical protein
MNSTDRSKEMTTLAYSNNCITNENRLNYSSLCDSLRPSSLSIPLIRDDFKNPAQAISFYQAPFNQSASYDNVHLLFASDLKIPGIVIPETRTRSPRTPKMIGSKRTKSPSDERIRSLRSPSEYLMHRYKIDMAKSSDL